MKMVCPRCGSGLAQRWAGKALYQLCVGCKGIAITKYALSGLADPVAVQEVWTQAIGDPKPSEAKCPSCLKNMQYAYFAEDNTTVELDVCVRCQLLWFDQNEYAGLQLRERAPSRSYMKLPVATEPLPDGEFPAENPELPESGYGTGTVVLALLGLPVEEDVGPLARYPVVTRGLVALVVVVSVWAFTQPFALIQKYAFRYTLHPAAFFVTSTSSFFLHADWAHLLGNIYFFWVFGDDVENELGHDRYLWMLFAANMAGNFFYCLSPDSATIPAIGASGGIAGLIAYYMIRFPYRRFRMMFFFMVFSPRAWAAGSVYFLLEIVAALSQLSGKGNVSHLSHLGGALVGVACAVFVNQKAAAGTARTR